MVSILEEAAGTVSPSSFLGHAGGRSILFVPMIREGQSQKNDPRPFDMISLVRDYRIDRALLVTHYSLEEEAGAQVGIISDHINLTGRNPLTGRQTDLPDPGFPDMSQVYSLALQETLRSLLAAYPALRGNSGLLVGIRERQTLSPGERLALRATGRCYFSTEGIFEGIVSGAAGVPVVGIVYCAPGAQPWDDRGDAGVLSLVSEALRKIF